MKSLTVALFAAMALPSALVRADGSDAAEKTNVEGPAVMDSTGTSLYDRFLYIRHNEKNGSIETDTLVVARITSNGLQLRDVCTEGGLDVGRRTLCVVGGKVYAMKRDSLLLVDLTSGRAEKLGSDNDAYAYDSKRLYAVVDREDSPRTLRIFDLRCGQFRDVGEVGIEWPSQQIAVSPDHRRLAFFSSKRLDGDDGLPPDSAMLTVVNLDTGKLTQPAAPLRFRRAMISSLATIGPPFVWVDDQKTLCLRTDEVPEGITNNGLRLGGSVNRCSTVDVVTGATRDVATLPGPPKFTMVQLQQGRTGAEPYLVVHGPRNVGGRYRIDVKARELIEDDTIGGEFRLRDLDQGQTLLWQTNQLDRTEGRFTVSVSPDGRRAIWFGGFPARRLSYYDSADATLRTVAEGWIAGGLHWFKQDDLVASVEPAPSRPGWAPLSQIPQLAPRSERTDTRMTMENHLRLSLTTDKQTYQLHEPVQVTVRLRNTGDRDVDVWHPELLNEWIVRLRLDYPGGSKRFSQIGAYLPQKEQITLRAGAVATATGVVEVPRTGRHVLRSEFVGFPERGQWRGSLRSEPVTFNVEASPDDERWLATKVQRLLDRFREEFALAPDWNGANETLEALAELGPKAAPWIIEALQDAHDERFRNLLCRPLVAVAAADALPFFKEQLARRGQFDAESVCEGLYMLHLRGNAPEEALQALGAGLGHRDADIRREAATYLARIDNDQVGAWFQETVQEDENEAVRTIAARYLAAAERLALADWLARAIELPNVARVQAAQSIVGQLEEAWHLDLGTLPKMRWEDPDKDLRTVAQFFRVLHAWEQWARENPRSSARFFENDRRYWPKRPEAAPDDTDATTDDAPAAIEFCPTVECVCRADAPRGGTFIDLDRGEAVSLPKPLQSGGDAEQMIAWAKANGVDVAVRVATPGVCYLGSLEACLTRSRETDWQKTTAADVVTDRELCERELGFGNITKRAKDLPATYLFKTREGGRGLLQIIGFSERPQTVRIRYRRVADSLRESELPLAERAAHFSPNPRRVPSDKSATTIRTRQRLMFHGLDVNSAPCTTATGQPADLWEERPPGSRSFEIRKDVKVSYHGLDGTVYYVPAKNVFYVQHDQLGSSTLHYYGPFQGDPAKVLKLPKPGATPEKPAEAPRDE